MSRKRYIELRGLESSGRLRYGNTAYCPHCGKANCCYQHKWVYHKWWEKTRPAIEMMMRLKIK